MIASNVNQQAAKKAGSALANAWLQKNPVGNGIGPQQASQPLPPAPAAPAAKSTTLPWDSLAQATVDNAASNQTKTLGGVTADENAASLDYGVGFTRQPDGSLSDFTIADNIDVTNPYSRAAALKRSYDQGQKASTGQLASQGQLYSGYLQTKLDQGTFNFGAGKDSLLKDFGSQARNWLTQRNNAQAATEATKLSAQGDAITRHDHDPAPPPAPEAASAPQTAAQILNDPSKPWAGRPTKITASGMFYQRASDGKWIPMR